MGMKLRTCIEIYDALNARNFANVLERPRFCMTRSNDADAIYTANENDYRAYKSSIALHREVKGLENIREAIYHEMIHQYLHQFLYFDDWHRHGERFKIEYTKFLYDVKPDEGLLL
jgi:SprT-like family